MVVLISSIDMFTIDREQLALNLELFPPGRFERLAHSVFADPVQEELIFRCVNWLRIVSPLDFVTKVGLNLLLCYRVSRLTDLIRHAKYKDGRLYPMRHPIALPFMFFALLTLIFVIVSVNSSRQACEDHSECSVHARRWVTLTNGELNKCPCLALVDMDTAPKSYDEWLSPRNVSEKVGFLGATGDLEMVYLVNKKLDILPEALKNCKRLRSLYVPVNRRLALMLGIKTIAWGKSLTYDSWLCRSLIYTDMTTLPAWTRDLTNLQHLYVYISSVL